MNAEATPELRAYAERARNVPSLLAHALRTWSVAQLRAYLRCDERAALRVLVCNAPRATCWSEDVAVIAAFAAVDRGRLAAVLRAARAVLPDTVRVPGGDEPAMRYASAG